MTQDYKVLLDVPLQATQAKQENMALGFDDLATAFKEVIENSDPQFAVGLFGGWGSGKTTLMHAINNRLNEDICAPVWFTAWRYEKEEHLIIPLLDVIREGVVAWAERRPADQRVVSETAMKVATTIGRAIHALLAGFSMTAKLGNMLQASFDANKALSKWDDQADERAAAKAPRSFYHASFRAMQEAFQEFTSKGPSRIVVFVDDLDRCLPEGALDVLESMKLFFDLPGFVFVVGVDRRVVEMSVEKRYREMLPTADADMDGASAKPITGGQYLRKIFQVPFSLAPVSAGQIDEFLVAVQDNANLPPAQWTEIQTQVRPHLGYLIDDSGVNPREIKRFVNAYTLLRKIKSYLDPNVVLALQTIAFQNDWGDVQVALLAYRDGFIDALARHANEPEAGHLAVLSPRLDPPPQSFTAFIAPDEPGRALVDFAGSSSIDEYIFSGEATRSSEGSIFVTVFQALGAAASSTRKAVGARSDSKALMNQCSLALSTLFRSDETGSGRFAAAQQSIQRVMDGIERSDWDELLHKLDNPDPNEDMDSVRERLDNLTEDWTGQLRQVLSNLQELYRAGLA